MRKMLKKLAVLIMALAVMSTVSIPVFAGQNTVSAPATVSVTKTNSSNLYTDVTKKSVGKDAWEAVKYVKAHHGFDKLFTGKKFGPYKYITRREFIMILVNLYGQKYVPVTVADLQKANNKITAKWACDKMVKVAAKLDCKITWEAGKDKLTRAGAAQYIKIFAKFRPALKPKR